MKCYCIFLKRLPFRKSIHRNYKLMYQGFTMATQTSSESMRSQGRTMPTLEKLRTQTQRKRHVFASKNLISNHAASDMRK